MNFNYLIVFISLIISSLLYFKIAVKFKIIDVPNNRSSHNKITIRGGGVLFFLAILFFFIVNNFEYPFFFSGLLLISVVSFIDDIKSMSAAVRFPFQIISVILVLYEIGLITDSNLVWVTWLIICGVGFINFVNFMDGINGITGLYSISVLSGLYILNLKVNVINEDLFLYTLISLAVFGYYNFRKKALFFAGDVGSISMGVIILFCLFTLIKETSAPVILLTIVVYNADALTTILYRKFFLKENVTEPHKHHIFQKLVDIKKISHLRVSLYYAFIQLLVNVLVLNTYTLEVKYQYMIFILGCLLFVILYIILFKYIEKIKQKLI
jgi:UDP-N-acetylmuramyl pentapeptide phosphotransferase/UDP-N-acetylglucosamine-1-phosphate transferase